MRRTLPYAARADQRAAQSAVGFPRLAAGSGSQLESGSSFSWRRWESAPYSRVITKARIQLHVAPDRLTATASVVAGDAAGARELHEALNAAKVVFNADPAPVEALAAALADPHYTCSNERVASGQPAVPGANGYFEPAFQAGIQPGHLGEDGRMDFFDRELLKPFARDECVGMLHRPVPGVPGRRVDGSEIKVADVQPSKLRIGAGLRAAEDGRVYALQPGVVLYSAEKSIELVGRHVHQGDVDMRSGNLEMEGALIVRGTVQRLFHARASGDIEIHGAVESGSVYAGGGLRVTGVVRGGDTGLVCAEGDLSARHAEAALVVAGGALTLETAINSELRAASIQIARTVRGGSAQAETSVVVQEAGLAHGTGTLLAAGMPLSRPVLEIRRSVQLAKEQRRLQRKAGGVREGSERGKTGKLERARADLDREELLRKTQLAERRQELLAQAYVQIRGVGHAGITVQIGAHALVLKDAVRGERFVYDSQMRGVRGERSQ